MTAVGCPVSAELLEAYFARDLAQADEAALEEHVFACDACARALDAAGALAEALSSWIPPVISRARLERLRDSGQELRVTPVDPGARVEVEFSPQLALLVHALRAKLSPGARIGVGIGTPEAGTLHELFDVPCDRERGEVLIACQRHYLETYPPTTLFSVFSQPENGEREVLGEYVVHHVLP